MNFTIRRATLVDFETILRLNHALFEADHAHDEALNLNWPLSNEAAEYYRTKLSKPENVAFVAEDSKKNILGYVIGSSTNKFRYRSVKTGELENMYVVSEARRKGVGKALIEALKHWLKETGVDRVYVSAYGKNEHAIHFYDAMGFTLWEVGMEMKV